MSVRIERSPSALLAQIMQQAGKGKYQVIIPPVEFTVVLTYGNRSVEVRRFKSYVERDIPIPSTVSTGAVSTAVVVNADGSVRPVPTVVTVRDGRQVAEIRSLANSAYALVQSGEKSFADVAGHWAQDAMEDLTNRMVLSGADDTRFKPDASITRAEFAAILIRALGLPEAAQPSAFKDVGVSDWYGGYVGAAKQYGLISGYEDGTFRPDAPINREQAWILLDKAANLAGMRTNLRPGEANALLSRFADGDAVHIWSREAGAALVNRGLLQGTPAGLMPLKPITRAETAFIVRRLLQESKLIDGPVLSEKN